MSYATLWEIPDGLWERMERVLPKEKARGSVGRPAPAEPSGGERDPVRAAEWLPMERNAGRVVWCEQ